VREKEKEEDEFFEEVGEVKRLHARYLSGEISEEEFRKRFFAVGHGESG